MTHPQYLDAMKISNMGTITTHYFDPYAHGLVQFHHVFWAFGPSIEGFSYCWSYLSIGSTHLYRKYKGCLLVVTGVDADVDYIHWPLHL